jgi:hypothetical protein
MSDIRRRLPGLIRGTGCFLAGVVVLMIGIPRLGNNKIARSVSLQVTPSGRPNAQREALLVTGGPGTGCFVYIEHGPGRQARVGYDSWGTGGPVSAPFELIPSRVVTIVVELPGADPEVARAHLSRGRLRVAVDGQTVLREEVGCHPAPDGEVYFGHNPIGGTSCHAPFAGSIREGNRCLWGDVPASAPFAERCRRLLLDRVQPALKAAAALGACFLALLVMLSVRGRWAGGPAGAPPGCRHPWLIFGVVFGICLLVYAYSVTRGTGALFEPETFGSFYDYQAISLLHGRLDVPEKAISGEAFVFEGHYYGYFGLTPAILRLPFAAAHLRTGVLSRSFMLGYYAVALVFAFLSLRLCYRRLAGADAEPPAWAIVMLILNAGMGSTLLFLGCRAYIYHEAILCGAAFAIAATYFCLRFAFAGGASWIPALTCALLAVHSRPTSGLFALGLLGLVALHPRRRLGIACLCVAGALSFNLVGYLKFKDFVGFPLKYHVQYTPERLARFGGKEFHLVNVPHNFNQYISGLTVSLARHFPYIYPRNVSPEPYGDAMIDMVEPTLGLPWAMPCLCLLAIAGTLYVLLRTDVLLWPLAALWTSATGMGIILLSAVVVSQRYTGDFCPFLICASSVGLAALAARLGRSRAAVIAVLWTLTAASIAATVSICLQFHGSDGLGVSPKEMRAYQVLCRRADLFFGVEPRPAGPTPK